MTAGHAYVTLLRHEEGADDEKSPVCSLGSVNVSHYLCHMAVSRRDKAVKGTRTLSAQEGCCAIRHRCRLVNIQHGVRLVRSGCSVFHAAFPTRCSRVYGFRLHDERFPSRYERQDRMRRLMVCTPRVFWVPSQSLRDARRVRAQQEIDLDQLWRENGKSLDCHINKGHCALSQHAAVQAVFYMRFIGRAIAIAEPHMHESGVIQR